MQKNAISFKVDFLGGIVQLPKLINEIRRISPDLHINIESWDEKRNLITRQLDRYGVKWDDPGRFSWTPGCPEGFRALDVHISMETEENLPPGNSEKMYLPVDPLKFDPPVLLSGQERDALKQKYNLSSKKTIVFGSVRDNEMIYLSAAIKKIPDTPYLQLIIVPREPKKIRKSLLQLAVDLEFEVLSGSQPRTLVLTEKGILQDLYSVCDLAVIGDSFCYGGDGQNPLEPAFYGKQIISGPYNTYNRIAYDGLKKSGLLIRMPAFKLEDRVFSILSANNERAKSRAETFIRSQQGASRKFAEKILARMRVSGSSLNLSVSLH